MSKTKLKDYVESRLYDLQEKYITEDTYDGLSDSEVEVVRAIIKAGIAELRFVKSICEQRGRW